MTMTTLFISLIFLAVVVVSCTAYLISRVQDHYDLEAKRMIALTSEVMKSMERMTVRLFIMKGLTPHHANSEEFLPGGMSWKAYEQAKEDVVTPPRDVEEDDAKVEMERQLEEARQIWANAPPAVNPGNYVDNALAQYEAMAEKAVRGK